MNEGEIFGSVSDGQPVRRFVISSGGLTASIMTYGAAIQDLRLDGHDAPLVLGFDSFEHYPVHSPYFGAIAGRYANRIRDGRFVIDGRHVQLDRNFLGKHTLHGGSQGYARRNWDVVLHGADFVTLALHDPAGTMGFPGTMEVRCTYRVKIPGTLSMELSATTDHPTICNLAQHAYFNLDDGGTGDILDHRLMIDAEAYLPVDDELIPTGVVQPVDGTAFDFRSPRTIRNGDEAFPYDHNFCVASARGPLKRAATAKGGRSGVGMEIWTTEPGIQFYAGSKVARPVPGHGGRNYAAYAGFCLEAQVWPDSPNRAYFTSAELWPDQIYRQASEYRFSLDR